MFDYLQKFNNLPKELREKVSSSAVMSVMGELEKAYGVDLAVTVMKVMVKDININNLDKYFSQEMKLDPLKSSQLTEDMKVGVFKDVAGYLGMVGAPQSSFAGKAAKQMSSSFFFDVEDEEEARGFAREEDEKKKELLGIDLESRINETVREANINFGSEEMSNRFKSILTTYIRGVRDRIETKQTLIKSFESGGMGFDNDSADQVLKIAETKKTAKFDPSAMPAPKKIVLPEDKTPKTQTVIRDVDYDFSALAKKQVKQPSKEADFLDTDHELAPPTPSLSVVVEKKGERVTAPEAVKINNFSPIKEEPKEEKKPEVRNVLKELGIENSPSVTMAKRTPVETSRKPRLDDVKVVPKITNPIDELRYMSLIAFRRLNNDPILAAKKIKDKIKFLEEDGYGKKLEGVKAWRESPVYKSYLEIGNSSINTNQPINVIIDNIRAGQGDCLSKEELAAVMNLNKELRF